ncbi:MAG: STAS domain-containing protein [Polyangiales bacterium]
MSDDQTITISVARLQRLRDVLAFLSVDAFDPEKIHIDVKDDDEFGLIEETVNVFAEEFAASKRRTAELEQERIETIERQRMAIADLSAPIMDVWDGVIALPVIGLVDTQRSVELTERLLERISASGARCVIVDVTGVDVVDTATANHLLQMIRSASLLGAFCVVSGISPQVAQTLVQLDVDLSAIRTVRNLKDALKESLKHLNTLSRR